MQAGKVPGRQGLVDALPLSESTVLWCACVSSLFIKVEALGLVKSGRLITGPDPFNFEDSFNSSRYGTTVLHLVPDLKSAERPSGRQASER